MPGKRMSRRPRGVKVTAKEPVKKATLYTLDVILTSEPVSSALAQQTPLVVRTIQMRGDQTLQALHQAIFDAFGRVEEHVYEFQCGKELMDAEGPRYVLPGAYDVSLDDGAPAAGRVDQTTLDALGLVVGSQLVYWFDVGDDGWHQITVQAIEQQTPKGRYPRVTHSLGDCPPHGEKMMANDPQGISREAADAACLVGEVHLQEGDYPRAIEAFNRAIENNPTVDAYQGRARAYRALAAEDDRAALGLK